MGFYNLWSLPREGIHKESQCHVSTLMYLLVGKVRGSFMSRFEYGKNITFFIPSIDYFVAK